MQAHKLFPHHHLRKSWFEGISGFQQREVPGFQVSRVLHWRPFTAKYQDEKNWKLTKTLLRVGVERFVVTALPAWNSSEIALYVIPLDPVTEFGGELHKMEENSSALLAMWFWITFTRLPWVTTWSPRLTPRGRQNLKSKMWERSRGP